MDYSSNPSLCKRGRVDGFLRRCDFPDTGRRAARIHAELERPLVSLTITFYRHAPDRRNMGPVPSRQWSSKATCRWQLVDGW
jgi:hypothetical protein